MPSRIVCFVCGNIGADLHLNIKQKDKGPYFPFLEQHEPPKGCRLPGGDGVVDSCTVCFAFLRQQWEAYERNKTPAIKRLYWLKRSDNGHFTGAEMKFQGEYMAQVMGLQYQSNDGYEPVSPDEAGYSRDSSYSRPPPQTPRPKLPPPVANNTDGALDLSVPTKPPESSRQQGLKAPSGSKECFVCFTCAYEKPLSHCKIVSAIRHAANEPFFPFLETLAPPRGSTPINTQGVTRVCNECFELLVSQWLSYERAGTPTSARLFKVKDNYIGLSTSLSAEVPKKEKISASEICYLCGQPWPSASVKPLFISGGKNQMFFPFIRELRRPQGARPLNPDGSVLCCNNCHSNLQTQWHHYELERVQPLERRYSLLPINGRDAIHVPPNRDKPVIEDGESSNSKSSLKSSDITQPLNIQISKSPQQSLTGGNHGLLAIVPQAPTTIIENTNSNSMPYSPSPSKLDRQRQSLTDSKAQTPNMMTIPHPLQQASSLPKKVCFICGEKSLITKVHILCSYPTRHEAKAHNSIVLPFFPFLANRDPAHNSDPMTDDGTVISCTYCFHSLLMQWKEYEESKNSADQNRWLRKYSVSDFICYVCGKTVTRYKIRRLDVEKFPFLKDHKVPQFSLVLDNREGVASCDTCTYSLMHQNAEYERMGVPVELRKYNWSTNIDDISNDGCSQMRGIEPMEEDDIINSQSQLSTQQIDREGLVQGSKPPPLTMLSPAGSKLARNTATVPPLNQVSPSNGLNSVSNNSALNATHDVIKHSSPNSNNSSPRSSTPKRAPPPLVYSSHTSTLTSPPVVTIAPTPSHQSALASDIRHNIDRIPSGHSTSSNYESLGLKQERDQRPLSRHSREDDRSSKEGHSLPHSARITPHSNPGLLQSGRDESLTRGFQPYRHGEDIRQPVPPGFGMDPAYAAYHSALLASHYSHPAYRFEDPLILERYRMMQPSFMPFSHPTMMGHPGVHPLLAAGGRYPPELLHQYPYISPSAAQSLDPRSPALSVERARLEDERQREIDREKEKDREKEREKEKWREKEREKEAAQRMRERDLERESQRTLERLKLEHDRREYITQNAGHEFNHRQEQHREELAAAKFGSITQGTPRDVLYNDKYKSPLPPHHHDYKRTLPDSRLDNHHKTPSHLLDGRNLNQQREASRNTISVEAHRRYEQNHRQEHELSRGQPPPLISPKEPGEIAQHRPDTGLFRPFEKESRMQYSHLEVPNLHNRKTELSVPPLKKPPREVISDKHKTYLNERDQMHGIHGNMVGHSNHSNHSKESYNMKRIVSDLTKNSKMTAEVVSHDVVPNHVAMEKMVPLISKLDKEEERLRKARLSGTYVSDDDDEDLSEKEEDRIERMMIIRNGPPLALDKTPTKLKFLSILGLCTVQKKKDKEFERFKKRRKLFREKSLSPLVVEEEQKSGSPLLTIPKVDVDVLCMESGYRNKCSFLASFNLQQIERDKRKELCMIREACALEKKRRLGIDNTATVDKTINKQNQENKKGVKRKHCDDSIEILESEPVKMTLGQLQQRHLAAQKNKLNNVHNKTVENRAVIFPESRDRGRVLSREFAEQFHESVLQTTRQKELAGRLSNTRSDEATNQIAEHSSSSHPRYHVSSDGIGSSSLSDQSESGSYKWPGITAVMEAYQRHADEQKTEHDILSERCKKLQSDNRDLNKAAEKLSNKMSSFLEQKQQFEDERNKTQSAIENLKKSLRCLR
ncbi:genetic suppressor element 1 isoform X3 [Patella vulgata]|uniref:genetic suppressor element 1 isoform X3 n=1 Tax=Patella vulgata TaxID=6465 RepID=UPI002180166A|nr:genetic suppressor element 1 isoform X3 [Patella vulgata]